MICPWERIWFHRRMSFREKRSVLAPTLKYPAVVLAVLKVGCVTASSFHISLEESQSLAASNPHDKCIQPEYWEKLGKAVRKVVKVLARSCLCPQPTWLLDMLATVWIEYASEKNIRSLSVDELKLSRRYIQVSKVAGSELDIPEYLRLEFHWAPKACDL